MSREGEMMGDNAVGSLLNLQEHLEGQQAASRGPVAIIGAGPAGLTAAYELAKQGIRVDVYEAAPEVGGMSKTIELWGQLVDIGPHRFFSTDARVNRLWLEVAGQDYEMVDRQTRILYKKNFFQYPITALDALRKLGVFEAARCVISYGLQLLAPAKEAKTFEDWVVKAFGRRLFEIFFKSYSEKLWGIGCDELDADFAAQRIKKFSLGEAMKVALGLSGKRKHKTLADRFAYPKEGTGMIYRRIEQYLRDQGHGVHLSTPVARVVVEKGAVRGLELVADGRFIPYDNVVSTMPMTTVLRALPEVPAEVRAHAEKLKFRNTILVYLHVAADGLFPDNWLYIHSPELKTGRITNFRNWAASINRGQTNSILALEFWANDDEPLWQASDAELEELARREIAATGLAKAADVREAMVYHVRRSYPVYSAGYKEHLKPVEQYLSTIQGFQAIGRYGAFKYNNQDHSILMGLLAADNILQGRSANDLWSVNTDYETYQEATRITETGLVMAGESR
ncbi:MAG: FAD-dependent oxidoreductase [Bryobacter sp.]|nr:FAD-dependent oxidoreductase [Bryobacter sp.]